MVLSFGCIWVHTGVVEHRSGVPCVSVRDSGVDPDQGRQLLAMVVPNMSTDHLLTLPLFRPEPI